VNRRPVRLLAGAMSAALLLVGCAGAPATSPVAAPALTLELAADRMQFDRSQLAVPANEPFAIRFDNREAIPHNVSIRGPGGPITTELFSGPATRAYTYPGLPAGTYAFVCDLHPEMRGTLEVTQQTEDRP
jgi:plastocyanin